MTPVTGALRATLPWALVLVSWLPSLAQTVRHETDDCVVVITAYDSQGRPAEATESTRHDVERVKAALEATMKLSADMRAKVKEACEKNGQTHDTRQQLRDPPKGRRVIDIKVFRDSPGVNHATAHPATGSFSGPGIIALDLGDIDAIGNHTTGDANLAREIARDTLKRDLAHEFDHLRDDSDHWETTHGDPLRNRDRTGKPVDDENRVMAQVGGNVHRVAYGGDLIEYEGRRLLQGSKATHRFKDQMDASRAAGGSPGAGYGAPLPLTPGAVEGLPDRPCDGGADPGCYSPMPGGRPGHVQEYLQGTLTRGNLTVSLGLRYDLQENGAREPIQPYQLNPLFLNGFSGLPNDQIFGGRFDTEIPITPIHELFQQQGPGGSIAPPGHGAEADGPTVLLVSLGESTGEAFRAHVLSDVPVTIEGIAVLEPVAVSPEEVARFEAMMEEAGAVTATVEAYCFQFDGNVPVAGTAYRFASQAAQEKFAPLARVLEAGERVRDAGGLMPDTQLNTYFPAISQWAVWTREKGFDLDSFGEAWLGHVRKNVEQAGETMTDELEKAVRDRIPGRWRDIQKILAEADRTVGGSSR